MIRDEGFFLKVGGLDSKVLMLEYLGAFLLIVNIKTIISKYFKENFSITQSSVDEMKIIFFLERYKKGRGSHKLMRTDQNLPGHIIAWSMWFLNSLYFFHAAAH